MASIWAVLAAWSCSLQVLTTPASWSIGSISGFILISLCTAISEATQVILTSASQVFHWNLGSGLYNLVTCVPCTTKPSPSWYQGLLPAQPAVRPSWMSPVRHVSNPMAELRKSRPWKARHSGSSGSSRAFFSSFSLHHDRWSLGSSWDGLKGPCLLFQCKLLCFF